MVINPFINSQYTALRTMKEEIELESVWAKGEEVHTASHNWLAAQAKMSHVRSPQT